MKMIEVIRIAQRHQVDHIGLSAIEIVRRIQQQEGYSGCFATDHHLRCGQTKCLWRHACHATAKNGPAFVPKPQASLNPFASE